MITRIFLLVFLFSLITQAEPNKALPLKSELLKEPIVLDCGLVIKEYRGEKINNSRVNAFNNLCLLAVYSIDAFLKKENLHKQYDIEFFWSASFIPDGKCYRCINDRRARFNRRLIKKDLTGYTDLDLNYSFIASGRKDTAITFLHELWHAMSDWFGIFDSYPGTFKEKAERDEVYARKFTTWLLGQV